MSKNNWCDIYTRTTCRLLFKVLAIKKSTFFPLDFFPKYKDNLKIIKTVKGWSHDLLFKREFLIATTL